MREKCLHAWPVFGRSGNKIVFSVLERNGVEAFQVNGVERVAGLRFQHSDSQPRKISGVCNCSQGNRKQKQPF